ncbi:MAG: FtsX-like permease family protein, partial [Chitinophagaceae bacterium]
DIGFNKNNLIQLDASKDVVTNFDAIKQDLLNTNEIESAALADHAAITGGNNTTSINWQGKNPGSVIVISQRLVSNDYMATTGMHITEGRDFKSTDVVEFGNNHLPKDSTQALNVIITQSLEKLMGNGSAIGKRLERQTDIGSFNMNIVGVIKDYVYGDMYGQSSPVVFYNMPKEGNLLYVRAKSKSNPEDALAKIAAVMKKDNPAYPFQYRFVDDQFNQMFSSEMLVSRLSRVFAALAIIISCLGLFGLAAYTAERRIKEIGIRKVLGASVSGITTLLSKDFLQLVAIACLVAFPLAWWMMNDWLKSYEYRIQISWWIFLAAAVIAILIALVTVSFQAIKAAIANPIKSLRTE